MLGVVQGLLGLVKVQVLGCAALGHDDDIRTVVDVLAVEPVQIAAALPVGQGHITGHGADDLLVLIQHHVEDIIHPAHGGGLLNVPAQGVALQISGAGALPDHHGVIGLDRAGSGDAGHNGLGAAGISGKVVIFDVAQANAPVRLGHHPGDVHRRTGRGDAQMHHIRGVAVHAADLCPGLFTGQMAHFLRGLGAVAAQCENQSDILRPGPAGIQLVQQGRHDGIGGHGPGDIAGNNGDLLAGVDDLPQQRSANGGGEGPADLSLPGKRMGDWVGSQNTLKIPFRDGKALYAVTETNFKFHPEPLLLFSPRSLRPWAWWSRDEPWPHG